MREKRLCPPPPHPTLHPVSTGPCPLHTTPHSSTGISLSLSPLASRGLYEGEGEHWPPPTPSAQSLSLSLFLSLHPVSTGSNPLHTTMINTRLSTSQQRVSLHPVSTAHVLSTPHHTMLVDTRLSLSPLASTRFLWR